MVVSIGDFCPIAVGIVFERRIMLLRGSVSLVIRWSASYSNLVISCDGISASIKSVKAVIATAPALDNWKIIAFRQRKSVADQELDGVVIKLKDIFFTYSFNENNLINLTIYVKNYANEQRNTFLAITFLYLDHLIGEYDVMSKLGAIDVRKLEDKSYDHLLPITELVDLCDSRQTFSPSH